MIDTFTYTLNTNYSGEYSNECYAFLCFSHVIFRCVVMIDMPLTT